MFLKRRTTRIAFGLFLLAVAVVPFQKARADTAPKPTMDFDFEYEISPELTIVTGVQEECDQADCSDARPLQEAGPGPQRLSCSKFACGSMGYSYSKYHRLKITFSDGVTRQSNVFRKKYFYAVYKVTVRDSDLLVEEQRGSGMPFPYALLGYIVMGVVLCPTALLPAILLIAVSMRASGFRKSWGLYIAAWLASLLALAVFLVLFPFVRSGLLVTLAVEMILAVGYLLWRKRPAVLLLTVVGMMNLVTRPFLGWLFGSDLYTEGADFLWVLAAEIVVWLVEAGILALALRKEIRFKEALLFSLVLNAASFGIGLLLPF